MRFVSLVSLAVVVATAIAADNKEDKKVTPLDRKMTGIDGKGVPMIKPEQTLRKVRRGKGDKKHKKRMATVATVRTQQRRVRTPQEVVESLFRTTPKAKQKRPRRKAAVPAEHKRVWADLLQSKDEVIAGVAQEVKRVDPTGSKTHVALCDGERALLKRLIDGLPEELRQPLVLSSVEEMTSREVAEAMGIPEGTVRTRVMRARTELRRRFLAMKEGQR